MPSAKWILKRIDFPGDIVLSGRDEYTIGRGKNNYGTVLSLLVSRLHCVFRATNDGLTIKDLNSSNGTYVNEQRISTNTNCILKVGDVIGIGVSCVKASDHFVFKLVNEDCEDSRSVVKNEVSKEKKSKITEISLCLQTSDEEEDENDEPLIIEQKIDVIDLIDDEVNLTIAGSTSKSTSSALVSRTSSVDSEVSSSSVVDTRRTLCIKKEKCVTDIEGSELCVNGAERTAVLRLDSSDVISLRENESRLKGIKVESGEKTCAVVEQCNLQEKGQNIVSDNQCVVKAEKPSSSNVNSENNKVQNLCDSFQEDLSRNDLQSRTIPERKIKEECINTNSTRNSCENVINHNKEQPRLKLVTDLGTSSKNTVKQEKVDDGCRNIELTENTSENANREGHSCVPKEKMCVSSSSRIEGSQKLASKRTHEDTELSLPGVSTYESAGPAPKKRKPASNKDSNIASNSDSSTNVSRGKSGSSCQSQMVLDVESDNEEMLFNMLAVPILDHLQKTDVTKSVNINPPSSNNVNRESVRNSTVTNINSEGRRNRSTFILSKMPILPAYLNPVVVLKKLDFQKLQETKHNIKQEPEMSFEETLFEESLQMHTSTPKQSEFQRTQNSSTSESQITSIINYSQSDDVIVIDDDDDFFMDEGKSKKRLLQKDEDCEDGKEEICVKQEVFEEDEQVIEDGDDNDDDELVSDWVFKLSQSSSPVIEDEIRPSRKTRKRSLFILDSDSSDEDLPSNLEKHVSMEKNIANQNPGADSERISKILFDDSAKSQGDVKSSKSSELVTSSVREQSRTKNKQIDTNSKTLLADQTNEDNHSENESDSSQVSLSTYAEKLLESAFPDHGKNPHRKSRDHVEGTISKEFHENAKSRSSCDSSRRTLMCSALPMKLKSRSKATTENRYQKKTSEVTRHCPVNEINVADLTPSKTRSNERKSKSSLHKKIDNSVAVSEKELKMKVKEDRKAKLKALTEQKRNSTTSNAEGKAPSKSSNKSLHLNLVKNTTLSRADKLAESLATSVETKSSKSHKIKVTRKGNAETDSRCNSAVAEEPLPHCSKDSVINHVTPGFTAPNEIASESSGDKLDQDTPIAEVELKIKKLSFKDVYKIPKLKQPNSSEPTTQLHTAKNSISNKLLNKSSKALEKLPQTSALRKLSASHPKKNVRFAPGESLCEVKTYIIEPGNILRRIDGKDIPVRKRLAEQAGVLYDTSTKTLNRVTTTILRHWNPRWLTEQAVILRSGGEPPPAHCQNTPVSTICPMLTAFSNYEEYLKIIDPLMLLDLWAKVSEDTNKPNQRMKKKYDITVHDSKAANGIVTLNCSLPLKSKEEKEGLSLHLGDLCILRYPVWDHNTNDVAHNVVASQQESYYERFAYVHSLTKDFRSTNNWNQRNAPGNSRESSSEYGVMNLVVKVKGDSSLKVINATLKIISGIRSELRHFEAIGYLEHTKLCDMILNPCIEDYKLPRTDPNVQIVSKDPLNEAQRTAVIKGAFVCTRSSPRICLIQGPPGTGKTQVILNIIKQVLYPNGEYSKARYDKKIRILLCAPSNAAADEMAERLLILRTQMPKNRFKMVRTGPTEYMRESVRGISLDELTKKEVDQALQHQAQFESVDIEIVTLEARKRSFILSCEYAASKNENTDMYQKRIQETEKRIADLKLSKKNVTRHKVSEIEREAKKKVLSHADIIVTTLNSSYSPQITEVFASRNGRSSLRFACCIIDEATQCTEPESLIPLMLGIERLVLVGDPEQLPATVLSQVAKSKSFGQSLFNRIWNKFQNEAKNPIIFLNTQYRMHPEIYHWPNTYIYHGKVITDTSCNSECPLKPYCLLAHRFLQHGNQFVNSNEARLVCDIAMAVAHSFPDYVQTIGIITPYQQQLQEIKTCLERSRTSNITVVVNTIDGFQGRECDVIIFSCVRTRGVGFMGESQRLNVALTRARRSLIICGNFVSLQEDKMWSSLLGDAMQRKVLMNPPIRIMNSENVISCLVKYT